MNMKSEKVIRNVMKCLMQNYFTLRRMGCKDTVRNIQQLINSIEILAWVLGENRIAVEIPEHYEAGESHRSNVDPDKLALDFLTDEKLNYILWMQKQKDKEKN